MEKTVRIGQFLDGEGRIIQLPKKHGARVAVLSYLAEKFSSNTEYNERQVNDICDSWHTFGDFCLLRRELVDNGLLGREPNGSRYCREAGTDDAAVDSDPADQ